MTRRKPSTEAREASAPWMKVWVERWLSSTAVNAMKIEQEGAFWRLLLFAWTDKDAPCTLPDDDEELAQLSKLGDRWPTLGKRVRAMFKLNAEGRLYNETQMEVYLDMKAAHERRVQAGKKGGEVAQRVGLYFNGTEADDWFEGLIWKHYPKRLGGNSKADARKAIFARLREGVHPGELEDGMHRYKKYLEAVGSLGTQYVKTAVAFFGPGKHWSEAWEIPTGDGRRNAKVSAGEKQREELARPSVSSHKSTGTGSRIGGSSSRTA